jgi:GH24 family phage-related lysozyme (muramidase)
MIPQAAIAFLKKIEGLRLQAYLCPAGVWTIGYGSTRINGRPVRQGDKLASAQDAEYLLTSQLKTEFLPTLEKLPRWREMSDNQRAAIISFAFNLGAHFYGSNGFGTITRALKEDWNSVPAALKLYCRANGQTLPGLERRRQAEAELWLKGLHELNDIKPKMSTIHYFLDFAMGLDNDGRLESGRLVLRSISEAGGRTHQVWIATTSTANKQKPEDFHQKGGPIPPEYRVPAIKSWDVETTPIAMPGTKGVEGNFYKILPYMVVTDQKGQRGDFGIHQDANAPGSLGCIVMSPGDRWNSFEAEMNRLKGLGYMKLPLFITYPTD